VKQTLDMLGISRITFYRWYDLYVEGGLEALADRSPRPKAVWDRIPQDRRDDRIEFALEHEALTTRKLAVKAALTVFRQVFENGLIVRPVGDRIVLSPLLIITREECDQILSTPGHFITEVLQDSVSCTAPSFSARPSESDPVNQQWPLNGCEYLRVYRPGAPTEPACHLLFSG